MHPIVPPLFYRNRAFAKGFTLLELLISIAILSILLSIGLPSFLDTFDEKRIVGASEQVYGHLQQARIESIARSTNVTMSFSASGSEQWLYGFSQGTAGCDLSQINPIAVNACTVVVNDGDDIIHGDNGTDMDDLILMRFAGSDFNNVRMNIDNFTSPNSNSQITFDPMRGLSDSGEISLISNNGNKLKIKISRLGMIRMCSPDDSIVGYSSKNC
ncbi:hypothetical protein CXF85_14630 [Colwellia sp. 75C3]|uniref:GspH/FimT family pseudopilin n=1 Tax=Colwellia sp. 75C3 TaxID=888425 RepID=UPI000C33E7A6|nr:GspH/FimT family pseudopilin [Colwellia sp. 75C3]PKG82131.1 hypothetical protein CXF85_14630 [Colwellia sp. 75C3]